MKPFLQMTLAVFIGVLGAGLVIDRWHAHQERVAKEAAEKLYVEQDKHRQALLEQVRNAVMQRSGQRQETPPTMPPPETLPQDELNGMPGQQSQ